MTDWREIVSLIQDFAATFRHRVMAHQTETGLQAAGAAPAAEAAAEAPQAPQGEKKYSADMHDAFQPGFEHFLKAPPTETGQSGAYGPGPSNVDLKEYLDSVEQWSKRQGLQNMKNPGLEHWRAMNGAGGDGSMWKHRWWMGW